MRRKLLDVPCIAALCNAGKTKHVLTKIYSTGVLLKGKILALYETFHCNLIQISQIILTILSNSLIQKSANQLHCFSRPFLRNCFISIIFGMNYKPINKNNHEKDAFDFSKHFCVM